MSTIFINNLLKSQLEQIVSGERQILDMLPVMIKFVSNKEFKMVLREDVELTKVYISRMDSIALFCELNKSVDNCDTIEGLLEEIENALEDNDGSDEIDLTLIACLKKIKYYQIACYQNLLAYSDTLLVEENQELIRLSLEEKQMTLQKLSKIFEEIIQIYCKLPA